MICLRCGRCCSFPVGVVKPEYVDVFTLDADSKDLDKWTMWKSQDMICPHMTWDGNIAICAIHDRPWFPDTPCGRHGQFELRNEKCRTGEWIKKNNINVKSFFKGK